MFTLRKNQSGFTLMEMIIVIVITGIIGGMVSMFLKAPIQQYTDTARRAELTDVANTAFQRMQRDIRTAVPNSVRVNNGQYSLEYLPIKSAGRYRSTDIGGNLCNGIGNYSGEALNFGGSGDNCFTVIGAPVSAKLGDYLVVGSTQSSASTPYDISVNGVLRQITATPPATGIQNIMISGAAVLPVFAQLDSQRFQVVDGKTKAVTYACEGTQGTDSSGNGTMILNRYTGYTISTTQPLVATLAATVTPAILSNNVSNCSFVYDVVNQREGLVAVTLEITQSGETVSLYEEIHVNNAP